MITIPARDALPGDVWTDNSGSHWIIDNVGEPDDIGVTLRLRAGRSQMPFPEVFHPDEKLRVLRTGVR